MKLRHAIPVAVVIALTLTACGTGGTSGESIPAGSACHTNNGDVSITFPSACPVSVSTAEISLSGEAFISHQPNLNLPDWWQNTATATGVTVTWTNVTTGQSGPTEQTVRICWFFVSFLCEHQWSASVPIAMGSNTVRITASDNAGTRGIATTAVVRVPDSTPPTVQSTSPADGSSAMAVTGTMTATFSEAMDPATINTGTFLLTGPGGVLIPGNVRLVFSGTMASFTPTTTLAAGTAYTATITNEARDLAGNNPLVSDVSWTFTTGSNFWLPISTSGAPSLNAGYVMVSTGNNIIVWGRSHAGIAEGARYIPGSDSWGPISTIGSPSPRVNAAGVWTGTEMIVWGGFDSTLGHLSDGGRFNPITDTWQPISMTGAPANLSSESYTTMWTGSELIIWGGSSIMSPYNKVNTGARYNPLTDTWRSLATVNAPSGRGGHSAVWTGTRMIVWGGFDETANWTNTGGIYNPATDTWEPMTVTSAPEARGSHEAIWTGSTMVIWGGQGATPGNPLLNTGGRYNPATSTWLPTTISGAPSGRSGALTVWTGNEMIIWGGFGNSGWTNTGGRYDPVANTWSPLPLTEAPVQTTGQAVWNNSSMVVWGLTEGARYFP